MAEPTTSAAAASMTAVTGLTVFGVATGLHPAVLLAGLAGGLWALSYQDPAPVWRRVGTTVLSAIIAGYLAPAASTALAAIGVLPLTKDVIQLPVAVLIGLGAHRVIGPALLRWAAKKAEETSK